MDTFVRAHPFLHFDGTAAHAASLLASSTLSGKFAAASARAVEVYMLEREARMGQEIWDRLHPTPVGQDDPPESSPSVGAPAETSSSSSSGVDSLRTGAIGREQIPTSREQVKNDVASVTVDASIANGPQRANGTAS